MHLILFLKRIITKIYPNNEYWIVLFLVVVLEYASSEILGSKVVINWIKI